MIDYPIYKKILFSTDFSENADCAFEYAFGMARRDNGLLYIVHVMPRHPGWDALFREYTTDEQLKRMEEDAHRALTRRFEDQYLSRIKDRSKVITAVRTGRADEEIIKFAIEQEIDVITLGTHGQTGLEQIFIGSIAEKVVRHSTVPVFIVPCKSEARRGVFK